MANPFKRRWLRFSLLWLFALMTAACLFLAHIRARIDHTRARQYAAQAIIAAGGSVYYDDNYDDWKASWLARKFDEQPMALLEFPHGFPKDEAARIVKLFPEAKVEWVEPTWQ